MFNPTPIQLRINKVSGYHQKQERVILMRKFLKRVHHKVLPPKESEKEIVLKRLQNSLGEQRIGAYEFYWLDPKGGYHIMGVLPERRKDSARVTQESIRQWGKTVFGEGFYPKDIFFTQVTVDEKTFNLFHSQYLRKIQRARERGDI